MPVHNNDGRIVLVHPKGATAEVLLYGATVISWKTGAELEERLFLSSKAAVDGTKPVRGGIPVVFPCFGPPSHPEHARLPQHGFARNQVWTFDSVVKDDESGVSVRLTLGQTPNIAAWYDRSFELAYVVTLGERQLGTDLHVKNASEDVLEFQALLHNYIRAPADQVQVFPLANKKYYDKTERTEQGRNTAKMETRTGVDVQKYTDSVYEDALEDRYEIKWGDGAVAIRVSGLKDVVVWNPQAGAGSQMSDMEDRGWERYVCVEPGHVRGYVGLNPAETWTGGQCLEMIA